MKEFWWKFRLYRERERERGTERDREGESQRNGHFCNEKGNFCNEGTGLL